MDDITVVVVFLSHEANLSGSERSESQTLKLLQLISPGEREISVPKSLMFD